MTGDYPSAVRKHKNHHPYDIPAEAFSRMMLDLRYKNKRKAMRGWEKKTRPVFSERVANAAAPFLRQAFLKAHPNQKVVLTDHTRTGNTICDIFIQRQTINWRFFSIRGKAGNQSMWMMAKGYLQEYWGTGDKFFSVQGLLGGGNWTNLTWIRIPLLQYLDEIRTDNRYIKKKEAGEETVAGKDKLEKLKTLTALYRKKLISRREYKKKVGELMRKRAAERLRIEKELEYLKILKDQKIISRDAYLQKKNVVLEKY